MKYILMMNCPKTGYDTFGACPKKDLEAHIAFMMASQTLRESGELVSAEGLASPQEAKVVRPGRTARRFTDGVFPESKEFSCRLLDRRRRDHRASPFYRRPCVVGARTRRRPDEHADRSAAGDGRAARTVVTSLDACRADHRPSWSVSEIADDKSDGLTTLARARSITTGQSRASD